MSVNRNLHLLGNNVKLLPKCLTIHIRLPDVVIIAHNGIPCQYKMYKY